MTNLITPQLVTPQQLANIFQSAYIKVHETTEKSISILIANDLLDIFINTDENRLEILFIKRVAEQEKLIEHEHLICKTLSQLNAEKIFKCSFRHNNKNIAFFVVDYIYFYTFGLNAAQLVNDCNILQRVGTECTEKMANILHENGVFA
ncbi:hypothetical protein LVJ85_08035 [Neisseria sp. Dent CA1/247]|uniref:hypothetical protein n=1 Tax=Neisseria sp. Dent CA1/247 TaxID=2912675 RepID=UPI001FD1BAB8|nr:hypothetical protein [Neisseria sp. Dent CA1/247]UOO75996.1 hypothetical protein LVJ85_08035 [Neisseria sp. Dent CA1/247]